MVKSFFKASIANLSQHSLVQKVRRVCLHLPLYQATKFRAIAIATLTSVGLVGGLQQVGVLQPLELRAFDRMMRLRGDQGPDPRLLIVAITEEDIRIQKQWPLSDQVVAQALANLQQHQPQAIGLDIFRDIPNPPGSQLLKTQLQQPNVFVITYFGNGQEEKVPPPPGIPEDRIGFSDFVTDPDGVVRRSLMFAANGRQVFSSLSLQLALAYLTKGCPQTMAIAASGVSPTCYPRQAQLTESGEVKIGKQLFPKLQNHSGAYQTIDARGYQILLNYRSPTQAAQQISLAQVLAQEFDPQLVRNKIVLIGSTAPSVKDLAPTPYSQASRGNRLMPGVMIHAQSVSYLLNVVLDQRSLFWFWPQTAEILWLVAWALLGVLLAWRLRHPFVLAGAGAIALAGLAGTCFVVFSNAGWIPLMAPALVFVLAGSSIVVYQVFYHAWHDVLTGLSNRAAFLKRLGRAIRQSQGSANDRSDRPSTSQTQFAVLFLDLDRFKVVNDNLGHRAGDQLLVKATRRIKACLRRQDKLARVGGDEFAILLQRLETVQVATSLADRLQATIAEPFILGGQEIFSSVSIGIAFSQAEHDYQPEELLRDAHTAMYRAKSLGKARYEVFATGMRLQVVKQLQLETDLRRALERQEFHLHYQPIVSLKTGRIAGFEALVRWQHPQQGLIPPIEFIPIAEETGLIVPLGQWILQEACRQLCIWQAQFPKDPPLMVSVNLSGHQFAQPDLVERIEQILQTTGLDGRSVKLEITETVAMQDVDSTIGMLLRLRSLNLRLSIDDFGTGYSSLSYLHRFPIDTLKVDRSFVSRMGDTSEDATIVQTITMLGHTLGMDVIAEGVETTAQRAKLQDLQCEYGQGYLFSKPLDSEAATVLLAKEQAWWEQQALPKGNAMCEEEEVEEE